MPSPIHVERRYIELKNDLQGSFSLKGQWVKIHNFLQFLDSNYSSFDTYCLQLAELLPVLREPLSIAGSDPELLLSTSEMFDEISRQVPKVGEVDHFRKAHRSLQSAIIFLYAHFGEIDLAIRSVFSEVENFVEKIDLNNSIQEQLTEYKKEFNKAGYPRIAQCLRDVLEWKRSIPEKYNDSFFVPVVEQNTDDGRLRNLSCRVIEKRSEADYYENQYAVVGAEKRQDDISHNVVGVVRTLISEHFSELADNYYHLQFSYQFPLGYHQGRSSELASAMLAFCSVLQFSKLRKSFIPQSSVAVSGLIDKDGSVESVDSQSIKPKLEAVFFSWMDFLVVPEKQKNQFENYLNELKKKYPNRKLQIIGLSQFPNFIFDRRIVGKKIESRTKHYAKRAWDNKFSLAGISTIVALLFIVGALWYGPIDKNPVAGEYSGNRLHIYNSAGEHLKTFDSGLRTSYYAQRNSTNGFNPEVQFTDLNNDGTNEVFWSLAAEDRSGKNSRIKAWSVSGDSLIWELPLQFDVNFPRKNSIVQNSYELNEIQIATLADGRQVLVASSDLGQMFPQILISVDVKTGKVIQKYVHPGHFFDIALVDINSDGVEELIAGGVNNAYWKAAITVLDITNIQGHSPTKEDYIIDNYHPASELEYILVPKTILGKSYTMSKYNRVSRIQESSSEQSFGFEIIDANIPNINPYILVFFDYDMTTTGIGTSDDYDVLAKKLKQEGNLSFIPDYGYFEAFQDSLLYWDGEKFVRGGESISESD